LANTPSVGTRPPRTGRVPPWPLVATVLGLAGSLALLRLISTAGGILVEPRRLLILGALWWAAFVLAALGVTRLPTRIALPVLAAGSIALGAVAVAGHPQLSDDLYRYTWDGRVQAAGIDPYRYPPDDPHLARLRDGFLWPDDVTCRAILRQPGCTRLNRPDARTIYPPLAELWFRALYATGLSRRQERGLQAASAGLHLALAALVAAALRGLGRDPRLTVLYAWCPLAVLESAVEAHLEPLAALGAVGAVWACAGGRAVLPGLLLGAGTAVKLLPALLAPVILRRRPVRAAAAGGTAIAAVGLAYLPHVLAVGPQVLGYLPTYLQEENYGSGSRFLLLGLLGLTGQAAQGVALGLLAAAGLWTLCRRGDVPPARLAVTLVGIAFLIATPVQPWYAVLLVALIALSGAWEWLAVAVAGYPLYFAAVLAGDTVRVGRLSYGAALAAVAVATLARRSRRA
jgi:Glycosyltransferase family 87